MPRIRSLKPEAFHSETLSNVSLAAERTFLGITTLADDRGRFRWQPKTLNGQLWSERGNHTADDLVGELDELCAEDALCCYTGCDGKRYGHFVSWDVHQRVDKPSASRIPPCPRHQQSEDCKRHDGSCPTPPVQLTRSEESRSPREDSPTSPVALDVEVDLGSGPRNVSEGEPSERRDDIEKLCGRLVDHVVRNGGRRPTVTQRWREAARLLFDKDQRPVAEVIRVLDWSQQHEFWRGNILSLPKFREKYDQLRMQSERKAAPSGFGSSLPLAAGDEEWMR